MSVKRVVCRVPRQAGSSGFRCLEVAAGHYLIQQGTAPSSLYFISSGQVTARLEKVGQASLRLETMRGGNLVGELGFYSGSARTASIVADEASTVYRLTHEGLERMARQDPELAAVLHTLIVRLLTDRVVHLMKVAEEMLQ